MENPNTVGDDAGSDRPTIMVTNDDGIDAPGLQALVRVLVSTNQYRVLVCAPDSYVRLPPFILTRSCHICLQFGSECTQIGTHEQTKERRFEVNLHY